MENRIERGPDGVYRWVYELPLMKNPVVLYLLLKIFFWIIVGIFGFMTVISIFQGDFTLERLRFDAQFMAGIYGLLAALTLVSYLIYAKIMGGFYIVLFTMDGDGILHQQLPDQFKKAQALAALTALTGARAGSMSTAAAGLNAMTRDSMHTEFSRVRRVKAIRRLQTIKLASGLYHNQIYVPTEDFDFVLEFILDRIPETAKRRIK